MSPCLRIHYNISNKMFTVNGLKLVPLLFTKQKIKQKHFCKTRLKLFSCYCDVLLRVHCAVCTVDSKKFLKHHWLANSGQLCRIKSFQFQTCETVKKCIEIFKTKI